MTTSSTFTPPSFANGYETPEYKTILTEGNIEIREYLESFWVTTEMKNQATDKEVQKSGFWKLFNYIRGENSTEEKISMTSPVVRTIAAKTPFSSNDTLGKMSFYLGKKFQNGDAPSPIGEGTYIEKVPFKRVGIISYGGYTSKEKELENLKKLGDFLTSKGYKFLTENYFTAGYDSPFKFWFRHNEVWVELI
jgi:hypothetical protein